MRMLAFRPFGLLRHLGHALLVPLEGLGQSKARRGPSQQTQPRFCELFVAMSSPVDERVCTPIRGTNPPWRGCV